MVERFPFEELEQADLVRGAVYEQGPGGTIGGEPISKLAYVGNAGGFRMLGGKSLPGATLVVLFSTGLVREWPDQERRTAGQFIYYGDSRDPDLSPTEALEGANPGGNRLLRQVFDALHHGERRSIPPFLVFRKSEGRTRDVEFVGLAAPGAPGLTETDDLVAFWSTLDPGRRFLNYRAAFTFLDVERVQRAWLRRIRDEHKWLDGCPAAWTRFVESGDYAAMLRRD